MAKSVSLLGPGRRTCVLQICNVNDEDYQIPQSYRIVNVHAVEVQQEELKEKSENNTKLEKVRKDISIGSTNSENISRLENIICENLDALATDNESMGCTDKAIYDKDTGSSATVAQQRYSTPYYNRDEMKNIIEKNVEKGLMKPCSSPYAAPVLLV